jgi:hypothetical protein
MRRTTYVFEKVKHVEKRNGVCPVCGKRVQRSHTFEETVNPYNRNADGTIKERAEVLASVRAKGKAWEPNFTHWNCMGEQ